MIIDIFVGLIILGLIIATPFTLISAWVAVNEADDETLGCPDPELHDRNNENFEVVLTALSFDNLPKANPMVW